MALTHTTATTRNAVADAVVDLVDGGVGAGKLVIRETGNGTELAELTFSATAFAAASAGAAAAGQTSFEITSETNATAGTAAEFEVRDGSDAVIFEGTVGGPASGMDIEMSSTTIGAGETVSCSAFTYTAMT